MYLHHRKGAVKMRHSDYLNLNLPELIDKANILKVSQSFEWIDDAVKQLNLIHAGINQRLTALELKVDAQDDSIDDLRTNIQGVVSLCNSLSARLGTVEVTVTSHGNSINDLRNQISALLSTCNGLNARLTSAESGLQTTNAALSALQANYLHDIAEITRNVSAIDGKVDALEARHSSDMATLQLQLQNVNTNLQTFTETMASLDARVTALEEGQQPEPPEPVVKFWVYYGGSAEETPSIEAVNSLPYKLYTDTVYRTVSITCNNQYCYYCTPADQPNVQFEVSNFTGGFEAPVTIPIAIEGEETTDYKVYRSVQRLNGTATYKIKP